MSFPQVRTLFIVTPGDPYPPLSGAHLRYWQLINIMKKFGSVGIFSIFPLDSNNQTIPGVELRYHCNTAKVKRSFWDNLQRQLWWVFPQGYPSSAQRYAEAADQQLKEVLAKFQPDLVIIEMIVHRYIPTLKDYGCSLILDEHNINGIWLEQYYKARQTTQKQKLSIWQKILLALELSRTKIIEQELIAQADQVWTCSKIDNQSLQDLYGRNSNSWVIPNGIDVSYYDNVRLGKCDLPDELKNKQRNILFLGKMSYSPNAVAVELLIDKIYPRLRQIYPDCRLLLVGREPNQRMLEAAGRDSGIIVTGKVSDIRPYLAASSVMVVPLQQAGGTRLKILEAFAGGCPVISTAKGAEGLEVKDGEHLLIREEIDEIIEGIKQIWSEPDFGQKLADSAYELIKAEYSWEAVEKRVSSAISELFS
ncbi:glycosyltransferase family 4 protein [Gloeothece verrucosa]|uniref:Glycosyl transferase group 1 n=1 Tax=Gloeothece verrucosa (strain PCC 7822) TaxID=497965 RepID=E0UKY1_GLOV7|nr:glycosyltransferase family 4 protein [Gloeothece verrucosa]ADN17611.1 glycosyl transferase group 1 [Gloeothece verrucosa PCC 7822]